MQCNIVTIGFSAIKRVLSSTINITATRCSNQVYSKSKGIVIELDVHTCQLKPFRREHDNDSCENFGVGSDIIVTMPGNPNFLVETDTKK